MNWNLSKIVTALLLSCVMCSPAFAAPDLTSTRAYVGIGGGLSYASNDYGANYQGFAGYNFNRSWSAELGYTFAQTADASWFGSTEYTAKVYSIAGQYNFHINRRLVWGAEVGAAYLNEQAAATVLGETITSDPITGWAPLVGTNLNFYWSQHISTGVGVTYIPTTHKLEGGVDGNVNLAVHF